jgi:hypothetical protein
MTEPIPISGDEAKEKSIEDLFARLGSTPEGLTSAEAERRLSLYGLNRL